MKAEEKEELSTRRKDRENQVIEHIFGLAFPASTVGVPEGKNFFVVNVDGYIFKCVVTEVGKKA